MSANIPFVAAFSDDGSYLFLPKRQCTPKMGGFSQEVLGTVQACRGANGTSDYLDQLQNLGGDPSVRKGTTTTNIMAVALCGLPRSGRVRVQPGVLEEDGRGEPDAQQEANGRHPCQGTLHRHCVNALVWEREREHRTAAAGHVCYNNVYRMIERLGWPEGTA